MREADAIRSIKGIGEKTEKLFAKLGIRSVGDLLRYYPRDYEEYAQPVSLAELKPGKKAAVAGRIAGKVGVRSTGRLTVVTAALKEEGQSLSLTWYNMPFLRNTIASGSCYIFRGMVTEKKGRLTMEHPEVFTPEKYGEMLHTLNPIYGLTKGLTNKLVVKTMHQALEEKEIVQEYLPEDFRSHYHLAEYNFAISEIHFPRDKMNMLLGRRRLVFDEFLFFILAVRMMKEKTQDAVSHFNIKPVWETENVIENLPYPLTNAQRRVWGEIERDMTGHSLMSRLVQGDVGSGKTIVAVLALISVALNGYQGAMMAPTEVLARQHYDSITRLLEEYGIKIKVELLTGSMSAKEKRRAYDRIECGYARIIIGTHALIQDRVYYDCLALVVTDEQHRFGVKQREAFARKGGMPHVLVMSATPIPRTLAIILYGDLDISVIDELPANRLPIKNCVVDTSYRNTAYTFMKKQVREGRQCYVICPMVEESEQLEVENVLDYAAMLQEEMGEGIVVSCLHGRMRQAEKDDIMERFGRCEIQILVSTTVIEVGIDVPNATVMMIENAERFGLAQLHQLRGRVGRGKHQSYCIFMSSSKAKETRERLNILNESNDGFKIASEDLRLRGPGDLFGIRQSGMMDFKLGDVFQDAKVLKMANEAADLLLNAENDWLKNLPKHEGTSSVII